MWDLDGSLPVTTAEWTKTAPPLPQPPLAEIENETMAATISNHPELFHIMTPVKVNASSLTTLTVHLFDLSVMDFAMASGLGQIL